MDRQTRRACIAGVLASVLAMPLVAQAQAADTDLASAEVRKVDRDARKLTLKHGPIRNLDMPGMTMVFQVRDANLLDGLKTGDQIRFSAELQQGAYVVTRIQKP